MTESQVEGPKSFLSMSQMRQAHAELLRESRSSLDADLAARAAELIARGAATGMILDDENERRAAQSLLDYWYTNLLTGGYQAPDAALAPLDPEQFPDLSDVEPPYIGLDAFRASQQANFFGRDRLTAAIISRLEEQRLLAVLGPSGSGKSSLVMAGILPALAGGALPGSEEWVYLPRIVPGSDIFQSLLRAVCSGESRSPEWLAAQAEEAGRDPKKVARLLRELHGDRTVVFLIDQFEEAFTLCLDVDKTHAYLETLLTLINDPEGQTYILLTMRTDFEEHVARYPAFQAAFEKSSFHLTPLSAREVREVIEKPAERINLKFEAGIVDALIADILGEQAALPLLQFSLLKLWEKRKRNRISWDAYRAVGGGRRALEISADAFYNSLIVEDQQALKQIFLKLVVPGEGLEVTGKRIRRTELYTKSVASDRIDRVLESLVAERLIRLTPAVNPEDEQLEIAHEALIRNWPALVGWIEEARVDLRQRRSLTNASEEWQKLGQDPNALWSGLQLLRSRDYEDLSPLEQKFLEASLAREKAEEARELEQARRLAQEQEKRAEAEKLRAEEAAEAAGRLRRRAVYLLAALVVAVILSLVALTSMNQARIANNVAQTAAADSKNAAGTSAILAATNEQLAGTALADRNAAVEALTTVTAALSTSEANRQLAEAAATKVNTALETAAAALIEAETERQNAKTQENLALARQFAAYSQNVLESDLSLSLLLALESLNRADTVEGRSALLAGLQKNLDFRIDRLNPEQNNINLPHRVLVFHPDGQQIVAGRDDGVLELWNLDGTKSERQPPFSHEIRVLGVDFNGDAEDPWLASGGPDGRVYLWQLNTDEFTSLVDEPRSFVYEVAFSPDGNYLAASRLNGTIIIFDVRQPGFPLVTTIQGNPGEYFTSLAWSPDGRYIASGNNIARLRIWRVDPDNPDPNDQVTNIITLNPQEDHFQSLAWVRDDLLISGHATGRIVLWDPLKGNSEFLDAHKDRVYAIGVSRDGRFMITGASDYTAILWDLEILEKRQSYSYRDWVLSAGFSGTENIFAISVSGNLSVYQIVNEQKFGDPLVSPAERVEAMTLTADGRVLYVDKSSPGLRVWDALTGEPYGETVPGSFNTFSIAPDSNVLWTGNQTGQIESWDLQTGEKLDSQIQAGDGPLDSLAISRDESLLAGSRCIEESQEEVSLCELSTTTVWAVPGGALVASYTFQGRVTALAFSPDNTSLAAGLNNGFVNLQSLGASGQRLEFLPKNSDRITSLAFSPDGLTLASGDLAGQFVLWDVPSGQPIGEPLARLGGQLTGLAFTADGTQLVTGNNSGELYAWEVALPFWRSQACATAGRNFTQPEWDIYFPGQEYSETCSFSDSP